MANSRMPEGTPEQDEGQIIVEAPSAPGKKKIEDLTKGKKKEILDDVEMHA